jgi:hypothetical protein
LSKSFGCFQAFFSFLSLVAVGVLAHGVEVAQYGYLPKVRILGVIFGYLIASKIDMNDGSNHIKLVLSNVAEWTEWFNYCQSDW